MNQARLVESITLLCRTLEMLKSATFLLRIEPSGETPFGSTLPASVYSHRSSLSTHDLCASRTRTPSGRTSTTLAPMRYFVDSLSVTWLVDWSRLCSTQSISGELIAALSRLPSEFMRINWASCAVYCPL